jgi:hypothetical protein
MMCRPRELFSVAKHIFQREGLSPLLRRGFAFLAEYFFWYEAYYLYQIDILKVLKQNSEADLISEIQDLTTKIVSTNEQADKLAGQGFEFRSQVINARKRLDKGAIALCIFAGREFAHIGWITLTQQAKDSLNELPLSIDFSNKEASTGGVMTNPKYRAMGLMKYGYFKRLEFLKEKGKLIDRAAVAKSNVASQAAAAKLSDGIYAEARFIKLLWWKFWREKPLPTE